MDMDRAAAISHIWGLSLQVEGEFCVGKAEGDRLTEETRAALSALGVTDAEMDGK